MRKNLIQIGSTAANGRKFIQDDWFPCGIPGNVSTGGGVYLDSSFGFAYANSCLREGISIGRGTGCYDRASFFLGEKGSIRIGEFNILNGCTLICSRSIKIGNHCMLAWGSVVTDNWPQGDNLSIESRRKFLELSHGKPSNGFGSFTNAKSVVIEDNVWVGFDAVIMPGVTLGRGSIIGSKTVIHDDVAPYAIVTGNPSRIVRYLEPNDTDELRQQILKEHMIS